MEKNYNDRCKGLVEEARSAKEQMERMKKNTQEIEEQCNSTMNTVKIEKI